MSVHEDAGVYMNVLGKNTIVASHISMDAPTIQLTHCGKRNFNCSDSVGLFTVGCSQQGGTENPEKLKRPKNYQDVKYDRKPK